jgi:O-antigen/teichoic acid export membrane protein
MSTEPATPEQGRVMSVGRSTAGTLVANTLGALVRFATAVIMMRILGASLFGSYVQAMTIALLLMLIGSLGSSPGIVPFVVAAERAGGGSLRALGLRLWRLVLAASIPLSVAMWAAAPWLANTAFDDPKLLELVRLLSPLVVLGAFVTATMAFLQGMGAVALQAWIERVLIACATFVLVAVAGMAGLGVRGVIVAVLLGTLVGCVLGVGAVHRMTRAAWGATAKVAASPREILRESTPLMGASLLTFIIMSMNVVFVGVLHDSREVGGYGAAVRVLLAVTLVHDSVAPVFVSRMGKLFLDRDWPAIRHLYRHSTVWSSWSSAGAVLVLVLWAPEVLGLLGTGFRESASVLIVLAAAKLITTGTGMCGLLIVTTRRVRLQLLNSFVLLATNAALNFLWVPRYGALGAAFATLASSALSNALQLVEGWVLFRVQPFSTRSLTAPVVALAIGAAVWPLREGLGGPFGWLLPLAIVSASWIALAWVFAVDAREKSELIALLPWRRASDPSLGPPRP